MPTALPPPSYSSEDNTNTNTTSENQVELVHLPDTEKTTTTENAATTENFSSSSLASVTPPPCDTKNLPPPDFKNKIIITSANTNKNYLLSSENSSSSSSSSNVQISNNNPQSSFSTNNNYLLPNFTKKQRITTLLLLFALNMCCYMDRSTIMALQHDVKKAFCLGDKEAGLLQTAFTFPYMFASLAAGVLGDRYNRKWIILAGSCIWVISVISGSLITTGNAFMLFQELHMDSEFKMSSYLPKSQRSKISSQFNLLLLSRAGVGIGDACLVTIGPTIIDDLFMEGANQLKALTLFNMAIPVGSGLGYLFAEKGMSLAENTFRWNIGYQGKDAWIYGLRSTLPLTFTILIIILFIMPKIPLGWSKNYNRMKKMNNEKNINHHIISCNNNIINEPCLESPPDSETANLMKSRTLELVEEEDIPSVLESLKSFVKIKSFVATTFGSTCCWFIVGAAQMWLLQMFIRRAEEKEMGRKILISGRGGEGAMGKLNVTCDLCNNPVADETSNNTSSSSSNPGAAVVPIYGLVVVVSGIVGPLLAVMLSNKFKKLKNSIECELCGWSLLFGGLFLFICLQTVVRDSERIWEIITWIFVSLAITTCSFNFALGVKIVMSIVKSTQKNFALGSYNLFGHLLGDGISGFLLGYVSDWLAQNNKSVEKSSRGVEFQCVEFDKDSASEELSQGTFSTIRSSLYILCVVSIIGFFLFKYASRNYTDDEKKAK